MGLEERGAEDSESAEANPLAVKTSKKSADLLGSSWLTAPSALWLLRKGVSPCQPRGRPFAVEVPVKLQA